MIKTEKLFGFQVLFIDMKICSQTLLPKIKAMQLFQFGKNIRICIYFSKKIGKKYARVMSSFPLWAEGMIVNIIIINPYFLFLEF